MCIRDRHPAGARRGGQPGTALRLDGDGPARALPHRRRLHRTAPRRGRPARTDPAHRPAVRFRRRHDRHRQEGAGARATGQAALRTHPCQSARERECPRWRPHPRVRRDARPQRTRARRRRRRAGERRAVQHVGARRLLRGRTPRVGTARARPRPRARRHAPGALPARWRRVSPRVRPRGWSPPAARRRRPPRPPFGPRQSR